MITQYACASLASENKILAHPASVDSIPSCENQEDFVSMGTTAARKAAEILKTHVASLLLKSWQLAKPWISSQKIMNLVKGQNQLMS